ncbi:MAG: T9SS type A sorting domain-containing protein [Flavobacteriales bacterium]|nr:T9SS type A sorting domain-containing protein [Flavobacteriales bacterium]
MKKLFLILSITIIINKFSAQSLQILDASNNNVTNGSYTEYNVDPNITFPNDAPVEPRFYVVNTTGNPVDVYVKKVYLNVPSETLNQFCWASGCWTPNTFVSPGSQQIAANDTTGNSEALKPQFFSRASGSSPAFSGTCSIRYVAYLANNPNDSAYIDVNFTTLMSIDNVKENNKISAFYPNPAKDVVYFNYQIENTDQSMISIFDLTGSKVKELKFNTTNGTLKADISSLKSGVYFFTLYVRNKAVLTRKIIVAK